jgi:hypothetical protein
MPLRILLTNDEIRAKLRRTAKAMGGQKQLAAALGIAPSYLSDMINGIRDVPNSVAIQFGYSKVPRYEFQGPQYNKFKNLENVG